MPNDETKPKKKLVKVKGIGVIAFPGSMEDDRIAHAIKSFRASNPRNAPVQTEQSEHARQLVPAKSLHTVIDPYDQALAPSDKPRSAAEAAIFAPKEMAKSTVQMTTAPFVHPADTAKSLWDQAKAFLPTYANTSFGFPVPVPNPEATTMAGNTAQEALKHPEYTAGPFILPAAFHGVGASVLAEKPARFASRVTSSNPMGEVRVGPDNVPSVWLSPKGWDHWMKAFAPEEKGTIPGMSIRADQAAEKMFSSKMDADPEWLHVQKLLGDAHAQANGGNAMNMLRSDPSKVHAAFNVLPEEAAHSWQRTLSKQGFLQTHLPDEAWQRTATKVPSPMKARLAADGYNVNRPSEIVAETAAKFITGDLQGTDPAQASEFLDHYFKEVTDVHGPEALNKLEQTRLATEQLQKDIYDEHQQSQQGRPSAGVPSVAAGRQGSTPEVPAGQASAAVDAAYQRNPAVDDLKNEAEFRNPGNWIARGAEDFARREGRAINPLSYSPTDFRSREIAGAYEAMQHNPSDLKVKAAYDSMKKDISKQWSYATKEMGVKFEPSNENPYANSREMVDDVKNNHRLKFYQGGDMPADHPLAEIDPESGFSFNDELRAIHDLFGHAMEGFQFGPRGEENAWIAHSQMFSPESLPALTTETKGQNSWVNFGPSSHLSVKERPFAQQKAGLLPERFHYRMDRPVSFVSPNTHGLDLRQAGVRLGSRTHQMFSDLGTSLAAKLGVRPTTGSALGHWNGGAENSVIHHFPMGTDPDLIEYHSANMAKLGNQNFWATFIESPGGPDRLFGFHIADSEAAPEKIASVLAKNGIENSTIEKNSEGGHTVWVSSKGEELWPNLEKSAEQLGVRDVGEFEGHAKQGGSYESREAAAAEHTRRIEELERKHPEWRTAREAFESGRDYRTVYDLTRRTDSPFLEATHGSRVPDLVEIDPEKGGTGPQKGIEAKRKAADPNLYVPRSYFQLKGTRGELPYTRLPNQYHTTLNAENLYNLESDHDKLWDMVPPEYQGGRKTTYFERLVKDAGYDGVFDPRDGVIETFKGTPVEKLAQDGALFKRQRPKTWKDLEPLLSDEEKKNWDTKEKQAKIVEAINDMPSPEEYDAWVKAGVSGKLWYERSSRAFDALLDSQPDMFRKTDKNKFLNFVAALSPVQPVRQNLLMAVNLWDKWNKAGRPVDVIWKDQKNFSGIASKNSSLYRVLKGGRNTFGVDLPARLLNGIRALQDQPMSGPKVSAFSKNLGKDVNRVTNDTWMAILHGKDPNRISHPAVYDSMSAMAREAGERNGIPGRQAQAAAWSFIKSLAELSGWGKDRWIPPQEIVKQGLLTPELINKHAADFADMLANDPEIRERVKAIGGDLDALDKKLKKYVPERPDQGSTAHVDPRLLNAAERLEAARSDARIQAHLARKADKPGLFDTSFEGNDLAFRREGAGEGAVASNADILTRLKADAIKMAPAGALGLAGLKAEAEKRRPSAIVK